MWLQRQREAHEFSRSGILGIRDLCAAAVGVAGDLYGRQHRSRYARRITSSKTKALQCVASQREDRAARC